MKAKNKKQLGCVESFSSCSTWTGPNIPCLNICTGDSLDDVIFSIAEFVCLNSGKEDLSTLSLQCLVDKLGITVPTKNTQLSILQILIDNDCKLYDLIKLVEGKIKDPDILLNLDLKCLVTADIFGNVPMVNQLQLDQLLINSVCLLRAEVNVIKLQIINIQDQIDNLNLTPYTEPLLSSCLYSNKPVSQAVQILSTDYCGYKPKVGTISQINSAIGKQSSNISSLFALDPNFIQNPSNGADMDGNQWIAIDNLLQRLKVIETTCCAPGCDKIKIGFTYSYDYDTRELTLSFTSGAGTFIPAGFVDCGSEFTFKDCDGNIILTSLQPIVYNGDLIFILPQGVCLDKLTVGIKTKFCLKDSDGNVILTCQDCLSKEISIQSECCTLCNNDDEDILIFYTVPVIV